MAQVTTPDMVTRKGLVELLDAEDDPGMSFYLPTERVVVEPEQNSLRLKNLLKEARAELDERGVRKPEAGRLLNPLNDMLEDHDFWVHQTDGLAIFRTKSFVKHFRLPFPVDSSVTINRHFRIKPLLPAISTRGDFFILALSQKQVRFFRASRYGVAEMDLSELSVPKGIADTLKFDELDRDTMHPTSARGRGAGRVNVYHGHGAAEEDQKDEVLRYCQEIDHGLRPLLRSEHAPLIVAGVEYMRGYFREATHYRYLVAEGIDGNPDQLRPEQLHSKARPLIDAHFRAALDVVRERYGSAASNDLGSNELEKVLLAAHDGRVDSLFISLGEELFGSFDPEARRVSLHRGNGHRGEDLTDLAARSTLINGGHVYVLEPEEMPDKPLAAVFRY